MQNSFPQHPLEGMTDEESLPAASLRGDARYRIPSCSNLERGWLMQNLFLQHLWEGILDAESLPAASLKEDAGCRIPSYHILERGCRCRIPLCIILEMGCRFRITSCSILEKGYWMQNIWMQILGPQLLILHYCYFLPAASIAPDYWWMEQSQLL